MTVGSEPAGEDDAETAPVRPDEQITGEALGQLELLVRETREEVARAESRAATLLAATGVVAAVIFNVGTSSDWSPTRWAVPAVVIWWLGCAAAAGAMVALTWALWPRRATAPAVGWPRWFGEVAFEARAGDRSPDALANFTRRLAGTEPDRFDHACQQLWVISQIADTKLMAIRSAIVLLGASVTLALFSTALETGLA